MRYSNAVSRVSVFLFGSRSEAGRCFLFGICVGPLRRPLLFFVAVFFIACAPLLVKAFHGELGVSPAARAWKAPVLLGSRNFVLVLLCIHYSIHYRWSTEIGMVVALPLPDRPPRP